MDEKKLWKVEIHAEKLPVLKKTYRFEIAGTEREVDILLDSLLTGFEVVGIEAGGGYVEAGSEA